MRLSTPPVMVPTSRALAANPVSSEEGSLSVGFRALLDPPKYLWEARLESLRNLLDIHERHVPDPALDTAVAGSVQSTPFRCFFLIDTLFHTHSGGGSRASLLSSIHEFSSLTCLLPQPKMSAKCRIPHL
jgi:hypothetical protein